MYSPERLAPTRFHRLCRVAAHVPSTMLEQRCRVRVLEFDEGADRRLTGQAEIRLQSVAESASPAACRDLGRDLAADAPLTALLVMGDGSARRSAAAPGYLDDRAEPFDTWVEQALRDGDLAALAAVDPDLARDLLAAGRPAWQVLAAALTSVDLTANARPRTRILYSAAPLGVAYLVATLDPAPSE